MAWAEAHSLKSCVSKAHNAHVFLGLSHAHSLKISKYFTNRLTYRINMDMQAVRIAKEANVQDTIHKHTAEHSTAP